MNVQVMSESILGVQIVEENRRVPVIGGDSLPDMPWQERTPGTNHPCGGIEETPSSNGTPCPIPIAFSTAPPFPSGADSPGCSVATTPGRVPWLHAGFSQDGIHWNIEPRPIRFIDGPADLAFEYAYDPRVCKLEDRYYITWCNGYEDLPTIGMAWTEDFRVFHQMENAFLPYNRNGVLFPRKIGGNYAMLSRPSDNGHTAFGDIFYSESPDMVYWGKHRRVLEPRESWEKLKVGAGPVPIETGEGWLLIYHGVLRSCSGFVYSIGAALLDREQPWKVLGRTRSFLMAPRRITNALATCRTWCFPAQPCATKIRQAGHLLRRRRHGHGPGVQPGRRHRGRDPRRRLKEGSVC